MLKENLLLKSELRKHFLFVRKNLSRKRRFSASLEAAEKVLALPFKNILSFSSFGSEISLSLVNSILGKQNRLFLPKVEKGALSIYQVSGSNIDPFLSSSLFGMKEPNPLFCKKVDLSEIDLILVPGLGFDRKNQRLGYGKGFYDALLKKSAPTIGLGFKEQLIDCLPTDPWDVPVNRLFLV